MGKFAHSTELYWRCLGKFVSIQSGAGDDRGTLIVQISTGGVWGSLFLVQSNAGDDWEVCP